MQFTDIPVRALPQPKGCTILFFGTSYEIKNLETAGKIGVYQDAIVTGKLEGNKLEISNIKFY